MPRVERRPWLRRSDTRAALLMSALLLLAIVVQALLVYAFVAVESLEEADRWLEYALSEPPGRAAPGRDGWSHWKSLHVLPETVPSMRILDPAGDTRSAQGEWPAPERRVAWEAHDDTRSLWDCRLLRTDHALVGSVGLADGGRAELALPLAHFAREAREVGLALALVAAISGLAGLAVSGVVLSRAFAPLRRATRLVEGINARRLGQRLSSQGTGDPVDRHAEALNRVLADVDATFERLRAFSADVAHELRTPLNRLQNVAEVALLSGEPAELKPALERVHAAAEDLGRTLQSLLLLAELDDHRLEPRAVAVDLDAWLDHVSGLYAPLFEERGASLTRRGRAGTLVVDRRLLDRVLSNLLENALEHGGTPGRVEIRVQRLPDRVRIEVDDAGSGIPAAMRERIFERFTRLERQRGGHGAGLGLAIARACARLAGGDLQVGESRLGGACFVWDILGSAEPSADA